jgi:hypothetical protein
MCGVAQGRLGLHQPDQLVEGVGRVSGVSDDPPIMPKWIGGGTKAKAAPTRRPIIAADSARFGDETVIMCRESRLDMGLPHPPQGGHPRDVPGVGAGVVDRLPELQSSRPLS